MVKVQKNTKKLDIQKDPRHILLRLTRVHFFYGLVYIVSIIIADAGNLIENEQAAKRWTAVGSLLVVNTIIWYLCRAKIKSDLFYKILLIFLLACHIVFAATNVFWQRGMASKAVALFFVPIISAGLARSRSLVLATASVSAVAYSMASARYFYMNYGQGYTVELYGEMFFYSSLFFVVAFLMMISFRRAPD